MDKKVDYKTLLYEESKKRGLGETISLSEKEKEVLLKDLDNKFYNISIASVIKNVNVELTTRCSSMCEFCGRQLDHVKYIVDLPLETFKKLPIEDLHEVKFEGSLGEPINYPFFTEAIKEVRKRRGKRTTIVIHTNGNIHNEEWWSGLAKLIDFNHENKIMFGLDGLEDTHAIHRKGTDFKKIVKNIEAFTKAGGFAEVTMIVFKHSEHQVDDLRDLCKKIGVKNFYTRVSKRYNDEFERPDMFKQKSRREKTRIEEECGMPVVCGMMHFGNSYLTVDGQVIPCFKWHPRRFFWKNDDKETQDIFWKNMPYMDLNNHDFYEILENDFLKQLKKNLQTMKECGNICRTLIDPSLEKK